MKLDTKQKLSSLTIILHWLVAVSIIGLLAVGIYMEENEVYSLYPIHKSLGFIVFFVILLRVFWRVKNGWPTPAGEVKAIEQRLARIVHWVLILGMIAMPLSGILMGYYGGRGVFVFGLEVFVPNLNPEDMKKTIPINDDIGSFAHSMHGWVGNILIGAIVLHILGALKHHFIYKDGTLNRMRGKEI